MGAVLVLEPQSGLKAGLVVGVDDAGDALANQRARFGIQADFGSIGNLLDANDDFHGSFSF